MEPRATIVGYVRKPDSGDVFIEIEKQFWEAATNIDKFSHIIVLWWITGRDNPQDRANLSGYPPKEGAELSGAFASRSPARPTPIGHSIVAITKVDNNRRRIYLDQIDALGNTPVVDIKPYMPTSDRVDDAKVPVWFKNNTPRYTS